MSKYIPILLCALVLFLFSACYEGGEFSAGQDANGQSTSENIEDSGALSLPAGLVAEDEGPVPELLDAAQQVLYRRAKTAYKEFTYDNSGFESGGDGVSGPTLEQGEMQYYKCNGTIGRWVDFESAMLALFTPGYFTELNDMASYVDGSGTYHRRAIFAEHEGDLYYSGGGRGGHMFFIGPETFELISQTEDEIRFYVVGNYDDFAEDAEGNLIRDDTGVYKRVGNPTQEKKELVMEKGPDGWRFSVFAIAY